MGQLSWAATKATSRMLAFVERGDNSAGHSAIQMVTKEFQRMDDPEAYPWATSI
jgi:hypothetical protein